MSLIQSIVSEFSEIEDYKEFFVLFRSLRGRQSRSLDSRSLEVKYDNRKCTLYFLDQEISGFKQYKILLSQTHRINRFHTHLQLRCVMF